MYKKLRYTKKSLRHFLWKLSFLLPVIFISLVQCTTGGSEQLPETATSLINQPNAPQNYSSVPTRPKESETTVPTKESNEPAVLLTTVEPILLIENVSKVNPVVAITAPCATVPVEYRIEVDISEQVLYLYCRYADSNEEVKTYPVSTSKYGIGNKAHSNKTPLGLHHIKGKIGDGAPSGTIFKGLQNTGRIAKINAPGGDVITTRVMRLQGLERGINLGSGIDSYKRYIYIHGTAEENKIGIPASHGCVRMYNRDVIDLFDRVTEDTKVNIRR
jgi:lipoprotein-anchoring transpeptidase ErfK/SrfK